ncbi:MAG TPA: ATPase, T2SS/T4P/T4SS family [Acidimicrobiia bacterium]|nr:ATPase, T2SS/T4P/T4SS family [Acidimicrobiia bacterium]
MTAGFLEDVLEDPEVEEVIVLGGERTFVVRNGLKTLLPEVVDTDTLRHFVDRILSGTGRRLDLASPIVSAQLEDGSRVHVAGPPVTHPDRLNVQIRRFVLAAGGLDRLVDLGTLPRDVAEMLAEAIRSDRTILVAGAPGAGKTTMVNCLLSAVPPDRRVVTCEEVFEISADVPDMTQMQTREAGLDGGGRITLRDLVRSSLRQRPDRIVVGEVRGPEALDLVLALNAGCSGLATVHANSAVDGLDKVVGYCVLAGQNVLVDYVATALASVMDLVVFMRRLPTGRFVDEVVAVEGVESGRFRVDQIYSGPS